MPSHVIRSLSFVFLILLSALLSSGASRDTGTVSSNDGAWLIQVAEGVDAESVAADMGAQYVGPLRGVDGYHRVRFLTQLKSQSPDRDAKAVIVSQLESRTEIQQFEEETTFYRYPRTFTPKDPRFPEQWHLENVGQSGGIPFSDIRVRPVWDAGISGAGTVIAIVDEGTQYTHPDLNPNWLPNSGYDYNDDDTDPSPSGSDDRHGTAVAGISVAASNDIGGLGIAYNAQFVPLRLIAGPIESGEEAEALSYQKNIVDVYNNSWGPSDELGVRYVDITNVLKSTFASNATAGRGGLGNIYIWAAGNGGLNGDNSGYDGYNASPYTISVGALGDDDIKAGYSEGGANLLVVAPSRGRGAGIVTTDNTGSSGYAPGDVYDNFSGTSAAAPVVAGVAALLLEKRPDLGWRDVQKILALTATPVDFLGDKWEKNAAGHWFSHDYGFGRVDASAAISLAEGWPVLGNRQVTSAQQAPNIFIPNGQTIIRTLRINNSLQTQHVLLRVSLSHSDWGDLRVVLTSPSGTSSTLAEPHSNANQSGQPGTWTYLSTHFLNEPSMGNWTLSISDEGTGGTGRLTSWSVEVWGTTMSGSANRSPVAEDLIIESTVYPIDVDVLSGLSDPDGDPLTIMGIQQPSFGDLVDLGDGLFRYTMGQTRAGEDLISVLVTDGRGGVARRIVRFLDPRPVARNDIFPVTAGEITELPVLRNDLDPDGDILRITELSGNIRGSVSISDTESILYTAPDGFSGVERIEYQLSDDSDGLSTAWVTVVVQEEPDVALDFDGEDDFLRLPPNPNLDLTDTFTAEAWINPEDWGEYVTGFGRIFDSSTFLVFLNGFDHSFYNDQSLVVYLVLSNGQYTALNTAPGTIELDKWQHVAVSYDSAASQPVRIYIDGQLQSATYPLSDTTVPRSPLSDNRPFPLYMGESNSGARAFKGRMTEFRIWDRVLSTTEISAKHNVRANGNEFGLSLYLPLSETLEPEAISVGQIQATAEIFEASRVPLNLPWSEFLSRYRTIDDVGNGWWEDRTLGWIYGDAYPWVYIPWLEWVYTGHSGTRPEYVIHSRHEDWGWLRILPGQFPWIFRYEDSGWLWYNETTQDPAYIFDTGKSIWVPVGEP